MTFQIDPPAITGSVSHGTLRSEDLLPAFLATLFILDPKHDSMAVLRDEVDDVLARLAADPLDDKANEDASELINEVLIDAINDALPRGWYFGANEGDGADFGVWQDEDVEEYDWRTTS